MRTDKVRSWVSALLFVVALPATTTLAQDGGVSGGVVLEPAEHDVRVSPDGSTILQLMVNPITAAGAPAAMSLFTAQPGAVVADHVHDGAAEILYLLEGGGRLSLAGEVHVLAPGTAIYIPAGVVHGYTNDSGVVTRALQVYVGPGPEERFRAWERLPAAAAALPEVPGPPPDVPQVPPDGPTPGP